MAVKLNNKRRNVSKINSKARSYNVNTTQPQINKIASLYDWNLSIVKPYTNQINKIIKSLVRSIDQLKKAKDHKDKGTYPKWLPTAKYIPIGVNDAIKTEYTSLNKTYNDSILDLRIKHLESDVLNYRNSLSIDFIKESLNKDLHETAAIAFSEVDEEINNRVKEDINNTIKYFKEYLDQKSLKLNMSLHNKERRQVINQVHSMNEVNMDNSITKELNDLINKIFNDTMKRYKTKTRSKPNPNPSLGGSKPKPKRHGGSKSKSKSNKSKSNPNNKSKNKNNQANHKKRKNTRYKKSKN